MWVYLKDRFVPKEKATVSVFDRGFLYGDGLFETLRAYNGRIFLASQHLDRLSESASRLAITIPNANRLEQLLYDTLKRNDLRNAILRLTITRGEGMEGSFDITPDLQPTLFISARPFDGHPAESYQKGMTATIVTIRQGFAQEMSAFKSTSFLNRVLARQEAIRKGVSEAILLNAKGYLAEGSVSNLFWVRKGKLYTPSLSAGILAGVTRQIVLELAREAGISAREGCYRAEALLSADEAFLTNTGFELMPCTRVNERRLGAGRPGLFTKQLHQAFLERVQS